MGSQFSFGDFRNLVKGDDPFRDFSRGGTFFTDFNPEDPTSGPPRTPSTRPISGTDVNTGGGGGGGLRLDRGFSEIAPGIEVPDAWLSFFRSLQSGGILGNIFAGSQAQRPETRVPTLA